MQLIIGNKNYSSWSMRAWLLLRFLDIPFEEISVDLYVPGARDKVKALGGETGLVPTLKDGEFAVWDTLAIAEYLYERYPQIWPADPHSRARARSICAEISSGLGALRNAMPVNIRLRKEPADWPADVQTDVERVCQIWRECASRYPGPWLFGDFSAADIFFAPVATRFQTYAVTIDEASNHYKQIILSQSLVQEWIELSKSDSTTIKNFEH